MSTSVLRRYTPPTCTLEIAAAGSVLSRWTDRTVLKNLRFQLNFDDPTLPPEKQVTIRGSRSQLEALGEAVDLYVQDLLNHAPEQFHRSVIRSDTPSDPSQLLPMRKGADTPTDLIESTASSGIYLKPKGLLGHELHLGSLTTTEAQPSVSLSTLQLFDLANALDEYRAEALTLPALGRPAWLKTPADWTKVAAAMILAVGATGAITKFVMDVSSPTPQVASETEDVQISAAQRSDRVTRLPVPANGTTTDLGLQPQFPPKPPTEALQPEGVQLPPVGVTTVPADQFATAQPSEPASTVAPTDGTVILVPQAPDESSETAIAQAPLADPLAETLPPDPTLPAASLSSLANDRRVAPTLSQTETFSPELSSELDEAQLAAASGTAFDTYPQIAEIRNYFQQNWQPPAEMSQPIQYRLQLNPNGSIRLITPMSTASEQFVDRTNMPLMDEPFVSPLQGRDNLQVRLVLNPDGRVQVFPDGN